LSEVVTTGSVVTVTETLGVSDGSTAIYNYTVAHPPIVDPSVTISDGTYSWNDQTGSSSPTDFLGTVGSYASGQVSAIYLSTPSTSGTVIHVEYSYLPLVTNQEWLNVYSRQVTSEVMQATVDMGEDIGLFRVVNRPSTMVLIPGGSFQMGDTFGEGPSWELPVHSVYVSAFYMDETKVTKAQWDEVANWAAANGYDISAAGGSGKGPDHPVYNVTWYESVKWCNARSEMQGLTPAYYTSSARLKVYRTGELDVQNDWVSWDTGYRLPTDAEWEKAARGGASGHRFPWSDIDTIQHARANYWSQSTITYDTSPTRGPHPDYAVGEYPYTSPVGSFAPNGYGLYDMAGNLREWCWDWFSETYYANSPGTDPRGPASGSQRVGRCGDWGNSAFVCRVASRFPAKPYFSNCFRTVLPTGQ